jgi:hypothetical protein
VRLVSLPSLAGCADATAPDFDGGGVIDAQDCSPEDGTIDAGAPDRGGDGIDHECDGNDGIGIGWATVHGEVGGGDIGTQVAFAGDVDGDGLEDVLVGSQFWIPEGGPLYAYYGRVGLFTAAQLAAGDVDFEDAHAMIEAVDPVELGLLMTSAGDVDGAGLADVLVGGRGAMGGCSSAPRWRWGARLRRTIGTRDSGRCRIRAGPAWGIWTGMG